MASASPFSLTELELACDAADPPAPPITIKSDEDNVDISVRVYKPVKKPARAVLILYHGGGAHSGAGYQLMAQGLQEHHSVVVYTPDLRGHGASGGPRGDATSSEHVFRDVSTVVKYAQQEHTDLPLFLGGHSSGGGLMVNYATWEHRVQNIKGYILVSPQLGHLADIDRPAEKTKPPFATVSILPFIINGITGGRIMRHHHAVKFRYSKENLEAGMLSSNTVSMANAITPTAPKSQFEEINKSAPLYLVIGSDDELFVAEKVAAYAKDQPNMRGVVLPSEKHLGILIKAHETVGSWIDEQIG